jgi:hypothetical protein
MERGKVTTKNFTKNLNGRGDTIRKERREKQSRGMMVEGKQAIRKDITSGIIRSLKKG